MVNLERKNLVQAILSWFLHFFQVLDDTASMVCSITEPESEKENKKSSDSDDSDSELPMM